MINRVIQNTEKELCFHLFIPVNKLNIDEKEMEIMQNIQNCNDFVMW